MTREVHLAYGTTGLDVRLPDRATVVEPRWEPTVADPTAALRQALRSPVAGPPLRDRFRPGATVAISVCDATRAQPRELMVPAVLEELDGLVRLEDVVVLVATGTHRGNTDAELRAMLGDEVVDTVRVVNHDARDASTLTWMGTYGAGVPVWLCTEWVQADVRITTGFVERTSSQASPAARRWSRRAWPAWTPSWCCTTRPGSGTRRRAGGSASATPSTTTCGRRR